ncbi:hypothetical protein D3C76_549900 [compost metagenome]
MFRLENFTGENPYNFLRIKSGERLEGFCFPQQFVQRLFTFCQGLLGIKVVLAILLTCTLQPIRQLLCLPGRA